MNAIRKSLAAKKFSFVLIFVFLFGQSARAGIPVIDVAGLTQHIISAVEAVAQTLQQIQQYRTQLQQYQNMLENSMNPSAFQWDQARTTMNRLVAAVDTLSAYKTRLGSLQNYLDKFNDLTYYRNSPCFKSGGCTASQLQALKDQALLAFETQKKANDASFKALEDQQTAISSDAANLELIQARATGATGQLEAIQYANQLASHQANQLLQIRGLLVAQQNAAGSMAQAQLDKKAQEEAAEGTLRQKSFSSSPTRVW